MPPGKTVLITPLDWGLGHASRCVPIIRYLRTCGCKPLIASSGGALHLLEKEFPDGKFLHLTGYQPHYDAGDNMVWAMARQLPRFVRVIYQEHQTIEKWIRKYRVSLIISDNRWGCWSRQATSVFITHQLFIRMPEWFRLASIPVNKIHHSLIRQFDLCWVPDFAGDDNLSGALSHAAKLPFPVRYTGPLTRYESPPAAIAGADIVAVLSGPEPQRSIFEDRLIRQLEQLPYRSMVIRGKPEKTRAEVKNDRGNLQVVDSLWGEGLGAVLRGAKLVIARSGYSTVMDLWALESKALFVPTPGQTEQEYLAHYLDKKNIALSIAQDSMDLARAIPEALKKEGFRRTASPGQYRKELNRLLNIAGA